MNEVLWDADERPKPTDSWFVSQSPPRITPRPCMFRCLRFDLDSGNPVDFPASFRWLGALLNSWSKPFPSPPHAPIGNGASASPDSHPTERAWGSDSCQRVCLGFLEHRDDLLPFHRGKSFQEILNRFPTLQRRWNPVWPVILGCRAHSILRLPRPWPGCRLSWRRTRKWT